MVAIQTQNPCTPRLKQMGLSSTIFDHTRPTVTLVLKTRDLQLHCLRKKVFLLTKLEPADKFQDTIVAFPIYRQECTLFSRILIRKIDYIQIPIRAKSTKSKRPLARCNSGNRSSSSSSSRSHYFVPARVGRHSFKYNLIVITVLRSGRLANTS